MHLAIVCEFSILVINFEEKGAECWILKVDPGHFPVQLTFVWCATIDSNVDEATTTHFKSLHLHTMHGHERKGQAKEAHVVRVNQKFRELPHRQGGHEVRLKCWNYVRLKGCKGCPHSAAVSFTARYQSRSVHLCGFFLFFFFGVLGR